ncbi:endonuclease-reverse transcriptase [Clonorchis sinensis]|uniref:Endonuclease-reverse transcriptase n=1 Tax=Clonorchis sinensis TaxID=79923 RepID=G7YH19_CLOSI|nr:endonuclease-reverse transcriptase [Clonorchis sinensis]
MTIKLSCANNVSFFPTFVATSMDFRVSHPRPTIASVTSPPPNFSNFFSRVHDNDGVGTNMVAQLACTDCSRLFPTKIGLSQHRRHAQLTQHNADKLGRVKYSGARWSQQKSQSLLRLANNLYRSCGTQTALFARLEQYFPGRSSISIKTRLWVLNWRGQQDESSSVSPEQNIGQIADYSSEADDYSVWFKQTADCAMSLLESQADSSLASFDLAFTRGYQSGIMTPEHVVPLPEFHSSRTFPDTWKTVFRCCRQLAHWMPINRKQIRRANYASIQTLYHQRRNDAASAVLDGSWKDQHKSKCGLPLNAEKYWKQCRVLLNVVNDSAFDKIFRDLSLPIRVHGSCVNTKEALVAAWGDSLHNSVDGCGLRELVALPLLNRWFVFPERVFPRIFIRGIQSRCNLLRTRVRSLLHVHSGQMILCGENRRVWCIFCSPDESRVMPDVLVIIGLQGNSQNVSIA